MKKKTNIIWIFSGLLIVGVILTIYLGGGFNNLIYGEPQNCDLNPDQPTCYCGPGLVKILSYENQKIIGLCVDEPTLPLVSLPINTWEEAIAYTEWHLLGTSSSDGVQCTGSWAYRTDVSGSLPAGYATNPNTILEIECAAQIGSNSGQGLYRMAFRPSDGCILLRHCKQDLIAEKGLTCQVEDIQIDPNYTNCPLA